MKKIFLISSLLYFFTACNNKTDKPKTDPTPVLSQTNNSVDILVDTLGYHPDSSANKFEKGSSLITKSDCLGCHKVKEKNIGPAYTAIADKYSAPDTNYLSEKIIKGSKGVWGEIPMTPHPQISKADAGEMAKYILSLKGVK